MASACQGRGREDLFCENVYRESDSLPTQVQAAKEYLATLRYCVDENRRMVWKAEKRLEQLQTKVMAGEKTPQAMG